MGIIMKDKIGLNVMLFEGCAYLLELLDLYLLLTLFYHCY